MAAESPNKRGNRWAGFVPVAVFLASSALLLSWWVDIAAAQRRAEQKHFEADAGRVVTKIVERLDAYDEILRGTAGFLTASSPVNREQFRAYVAALQLEKAYKGIQGVGFAVAIPPAGLGEHVRKMRADGFPEYEVRPPGQRERYSSIVYLEPFSGRNLRAFGYDMYSEAIRREAMASARDRGDAATSGRVTLVQETDQEVQPGVLIYVPVYGKGPVPVSEEERRERLMGWAYSPLRMKDLMDGILEFDRVPFRMEVFDSQETVAEHLIYDTRPEDREPVVLAFSRTLPVNQRTWAVRFSAGAGYVDVGRSRPVAVDLAFLALLVLLLTGLSTVAVASWRSRQRAITLSRSLAESEARWRATFEHAPVGIFTVDAADRFLLVNRRYCEITGYTPEEIRSRTRIDVVHPDDRSRDAEVARRVRSGEIDVGTLERRGQRRDGTTFWGEITLTREAGASGGAAHMIGVLEDVTSRHEAEEKFREIAERSLAGILIVQDERVVYANPAACQIAGVEATVLLREGARVIEDVVHPDDRRMLVEARQRELTQQEAAPSDVAYRVVRPDGTVRKVRRLRQRILHGGHTAALLTLLDVTEQERAEEELRKAQRLESLGLVAAGIAHDFNNLLTSVFGQVELARGHVGPSSPAAGELDVALSAVSRARDLTRQLLTFATGGAPERRILDVRRLLEDATRLGLGGSSLRARFELEPGLPSVEADEGQMSQMLNNLLVNARHAMAGSGEVVLRAHRRSLRDGEVPGLEAGDFVELSVRDRGHGIAPEILHRVFDPFFTTRPSGTGLGLATSYSIVRRHGGHIGIESEIGEGTTVTVLLPAAHGSPAVPAPPAPASRAAWPLRVLFMDDEPLVLKVGVKQARKLGLEVETAVDGAEAVERFRRGREEGRPFDVVVLDLTVPGGMGGAQALDRMREIDPGVVAIACSGYFDAAVMSEPARFGFTAVLAKPYLTADLARAIAVATAVVR